MGTASSGVGGSAAMLTGDKKYLTKRQEKFRELKASHGGVVSGLKAGEIANFLVFYSADLIAHGLYH